MSASDFLDNKSPLPCPLCKKLFRLPDGFTTEHALACPHCDQQVTGHQIMEALAPTASLVEVPVAKTEGVTKPSVGRATRSFDEQDFVIPKPLKTALRSSRRSHPERVLSGGNDDSAEQDSVSEESPDNASAGDGESAQENTPQVRVTPAGSRRGRTGQSGRSRSRSKKKKETGPLGELFKILLGAIVALPIAQLLLWWAFSMDPLNLVEKVNPYASILVPPTLKPAPEIADDDEGRLSDTLPGLNVNDQDKVPIPPGFGQ